MSNLLSTSVILWLSLMAWACGRSSGDDEGGGGGAVVSYQAVRGSVKSLTGSQSEMARWAVAFIERDTGVTRVADVDLAGNYELSRLAISAAQTIVLLDPQYRLAAVLSHPGETTATVRQFFTLPSGLMPTLVHAGPILQFADASQISFTKDIAADADFDAIPDGVDTSSELVGSSELWGGFTSTFHLMDTKSNVDTDRDGTLNTTDADIDGDGLVNWVDSDDDGDGIIDIFDADANGDGILDSIQWTGDSYFGSGLASAAVQVSQQVQEDGTLRTSLIFTGRLLGDIIPDAITVRGPGVLLDSASAVLVDPASGVATEQPWDRTLADDGLNEDGAAGDGVFARKVILATGKAPKPNQMLFLQLETKEGQKKILTEFPYTFPNISTAAIAGTYAVTKREVTLAGSPFKGIKEFNWMVHIYDQDGIKVFSSEPVSGATATYTIPETVLEDGVSYTAVIVASSLDRIPSYPAWIIRSASFKLE